MMMVPACSVASVKMRELNGCEQELRGVFEYAHYTTMSLHRGDIAWGHREPQRHLLYGTLFWMFYFTRRK